MWEPLTAFIREHNSFLITTHVFPDGDAVGSALSLARMLRRLGKKALVVIDHPVPKVFRFLDTQKTIKVYDPSWSKRMVACDAAVVVDVGTLDRLGQVGREIRRASMKTACIDHHRTNSHFADVNVVDTHASSTGEMIHTLACELDIKLTPAIADGLFVAVATDTGWFRFPNTTPHTHRLAAELMEHGAKPDRIYRQVYETVEWPRLTLMKHVLDTLSSASDGQIAYFYATEAMMSEAGATHEDAEGFTDIPRVLRGVKLIIFFREADGQIKVSLRSKDGPSVEKLARKYGGGGHAKAAGISMKGPLKTTMNTILGEAKRLLSH
jgi:bifunctional oligoribonuclease and PAP phosphatase NrnA